MSGAQSVPIYSHQFIRAHLSGSKLLKKSQVKANPPHTVGGIPSPLTHSQSCGSKGLTQQGCGWESSRCFKKEEPVLGSPFLLFKLVEKFHLLPVGSFPPSPAAGPSGSSNSRTCWERQGCQWVASSWPRCWPRRASQRATAMGTTVGWH